MGRLDVLRTLDGVEPGLTSLSRAARAGLRVLNRSSTLLAAHDKLLTAAILRRSGIAHPATVHLVSAQPVPFELPVVVKPRFGSWGRSVKLCRTEAEYADCLERIRSRSWFTRHGALVQELVPCQSRDLRLIVAGGKVVGASTRVARAGEWRTNISLGGHLEAAEPSPDACRLAVAAAAAIRGDLVGVDLLPTATGHIVLELQRRGRFRQPVRTPRPLALRGHRQSPGASGRQRRAGGRGRSGSVVLRATFRSFP